MTKRTLQRLSFPTYVLSWLVVMYTLGCGRVMYAEAPCTAPSAGSKGEYTIAAGTLRQGSQTQEFEVKAQRVLAAKITVLDPQEQSFLIAEIRNFAGDAVELVIQKKTDPWITGTSVYQTTTFVAGDSPFLLGDVVVDIPNPCMVNFLNDTFDDQEVRLTMKRVAAPGS